MRSLFRTIRHSLLAKHSIQSPTSPVSPNGWLSGRAGRYLLYAIGEIALVVIGILIALQINNWNEWRKDRINEKQVLQDIWVSLNRNNEVIENGLKQINRFNNSSDIIISAIDNQRPYSDTLNAHFLLATRTGGIMFPVSMEGYESLKNMGFEIIRSKNLKDRILRLFEVSYMSLKLKAEWAMQMPVTDQMLLSRFKVLKGEEWVPNDYEGLINDNWYYSYLVVTMESLRNFLRNEAENCLQQNREVMQLIRDETGEFEIQ